jgi:Alr-MurF fusion protein
LTYSILDIANIIQATHIDLKDTDIEFLLIDSRKLSYPEKSLFFALHSSRKDGHEFINELYEKGVRNFVVQKHYSIKDTDANFLMVDDVLAALQQLAAHHRASFKKGDSLSSIPVIGITGSNGKTIVKEWLYQLLQDDQHIVRSPRSYNSQIGVALSIWQMNQTHSLAIFEAGISTKNEMNALWKMIRPSIGVFTGIGHAHDEGFKNRLEKLEEKLQLFRLAEHTVLAINEMTQDEQELICLQFPKAFTWSRKSSASLQVLSEERLNNTTSITAVIAGKEEKITIPFADPISIDNAITCWGVLKILGYQSDIIAARMKLLEPVEMRMQLKTGINNCYLINDSYSNDLSSLSIALSYLKQQAGAQKTTLILSDILQTGFNNQELYQQVASELVQQKLHRFIGIGSQISAHKNSFLALGIHCDFYDSTDTFLQESTHHLFQNEYILLKGARVFEFERISKWLEKQQHQTVMEINLTAMLHNLKSYQQKLKPTTKVMAMVKAFSYGSGTVEVARLLEFHKVDYLAVAYADEGVVLRKAGIRLPIMVMSPDEASFDSLLEYHLEPELFSNGIFHSFELYIQKQGIANFPVHIKFNTGMNRLGFETNEATVLAEKIKKNHSFLVKSVFSHLAASESAEMDEFTLEQSKLFDAACFDLANGLGYPFIKHLSNTAAIFRKPELQYDMVRLGIGLYGVDTANEKELALQTVASLKSTIAQIRTIPENETVGYNRKGKLNRLSKIATVRIGYADGFNRRLGNGKVSMFVNGRLAPVIGNVCMDMTMIDITDIPEVFEGDQVEIFGNNLSVQQLADWSDTIPYEIMTGISQRVKRVYVEE